MDSGESSAMGIAKLKARLEALERTHAREIADLRESIDRLESGSEPKPSPVPPPMPDVSAPRPESPPEPEVEPAPPMVAAVPAEPASIPEPAPIPEPVREEIPPPPSPLAPKGSMELQIGRVWLVRIGVVLLLTGLVLLGNYAYQNWIRELPAGLRLAALFLASFGMGWGGWKLAGKERTERFGEVLLAGGMAFFYWCTFAAHQVERLRVIESPVLAAIALLGAAAGIVTISIRRKAPLTAMMGLLMASYATTLQPVGWLAAVSNTALAAGGIVLMRRPGWSRVGFVSMVSIYASYFWWNLMGASGADPGSHGIWFIAATWALFALPGVVGMAGRFEASLSPRATAWFVGLNNAVAFGLISLQWLMMEWDAYWRVPAVFGGVLVALGALSRGRDRGSSTQLSQGLAMMTLALLLKLQGYQLAVGLGIEAVALAGAFWRFRRLPELSFSLLATVGAVVVTLVDPHATALTGGFVALCLALATVLVRWGSVSSEEDSTVQRVALPGSVTVLSSASVVAFFGWIIALGDEWQAGLAAVIGLALGAAYLVGGGRRWFPQVREASLAFMAGAVALMLWHGDDVSSVPASVVGVCAAVAAFLWEKRSSATGVHALAWVHALVVPLALTLSIHLWGLGEGVSLVLLTGAIPGMVLAFRWIGCRSLVLGSASLLLLSFWLTVVELDQHSALGFLTMGSAIATLGCAVFRVKGSGLDRNILHALTRTIATVCWLHAWVGLLPSGWVEVIPMTTLAAWLVVRHLKLNWRLPELLVLVVVSAVGFGSSLATASWGMQSSPVFAHGGGFVLSLAWLTFASGLLPKPFRRVIQGVFAGAASLWVTQFTAVLFGWQPMVILWSALGFGWVAVGLWRRMATLRHVGFILLGVAFAKLFLVDVWAFGNFMRVMAFIALGVALVALGFFYNRFAPVLKRLLESEEEAQV